MRRCVISIGTPPLRLFQLPSVTSLQSLCNDALKPPNDAFEAFKPLESSLPTRLLAQNMPTLNPVPLKRLFPEGFPHGKCLRNTYLTLTKHLTYRRKESKSSDSLDCSADIDSIKVIKKLVRSLLLIKKLHNFAASKPMM